MARRCMFCGISASNPTIETAINQLAAELVAVKLALPVPCRDQVVELFLASAKRFERELVASATAYIEKESL